MIAIVSEDTSGKRYTSLFRDGETAAMGFVVQRVDLFTRKVITEQFIPGPALQEAEVTP